MRRTIVGFAAAVGMALASGSAAQAATVFSQTGMSIDGGSFSDFALPQLVYDDFSLSATTVITDLVWRGSYAAGNGIASDNFSIFFFEDTGLSGTAALGSSLGSFSLGGVSRRDTGIDVGTTDLFEYSDTLGTGIELEGGSYWISIVNLTLFDADDWFWGSGSPGDGFLVGSALGSAFDVVGSRDNYFILESNPAVIPVPAALPLLASGLGLMGLLAWRRRRGVHG